jgi:predicted transcriptional regulator
MIQSHLFMNICCPYYFKQGERKNMTSNTVGTIRLSSQLQMGPTEYAGETKLIKLRQNSGWNFISGSKRGRLEIMAEILYHCNQQKTKTNIMYKANLNYAQLKKHLKSLTSQGLLTTNKNRYATTQKGYSFLALFSQLNDILNC